VRHVAAVDSGAWRAELLVGVELVRLDVVRLLQLVVRGLLLLLLLVQRQRLLLVERLLLVCLVRLVRLLLHNRVVVVEGNATAAADEFQLCTTDTHRHAVVAKVAG
jgi:hypothetical protein